MINPDAVNGAFELIGAPFIALSILKLVREKEVHGVSWVHVGYFTLWGYWNLYYYPFLEQWWSLCGTIGVTLVNTIWLILLIYYYRRGK